MHDNDTVAMILPKDVHQRLGKLATYCKMAPSDVVGLLVDRALIMAQQDAWRVTQQEALRDIQ